MIAAIVLLSMLVYIMNILAPDIETLVITHEPTSVRGIRTIAIPGFKVLDITANTSARICVGANMCSHGNMFTWVRNDTLRISAVDPTLITIKIHHVDSFIMHTPIIGGLAGFLLG